MADRSHEVGYESLSWADWHMLTGLPREAYDEWLEMDAESRRDVVGMFQEPETMDEIREVVKNGR